MVSKLYLFDIDGTILSTHGAPRVAMKKVLDSRFPGFEYDNNYNFSGKTDWEIVDHLLNNSGISVTVTEQLIRQLLDQFAEELEKQLKLVPKPNIFPGVENLLSMLSSTDGLYLGLVTGNSRQGAKHKLSAAGLFDFFEVGGFGDDAKHRDDLPGFAVKRAEEYFGVEFSKENTWIIGDSIFDVRCAVNNHLRCLTVCTGWTSKQELQAENPEYLLENLQDVNNVFSILTQK